MSRALGTSKLSWSTYAKEMLAIIEAIRMWRPYLLGQKFYIQTDQRSLKYLLEQRMVTPEQQKWVAKLLGFDYEILYRPGRENNAADALSKVAGSPTLDALSISRAHIWEEIKAVAVGHPYMDQIRNLAIANPGTPYTLRNGLVLYKNRVVYLRCLVHQQPHKWSSLLPWAEFWYNTAYHASIRMTPFQALYGRLPPTIPQYQVGNPPVHEVDQNLTSRDVLLRQLKDNLHAASNRMKQVADSKRRDIEFEEGDMVFLKLHPYRQQTVFKRAYQKLASRFYGPYLIEKRVGKVAYRLQLPAGSRIHPVFHVSLLKKKVGKAYALSNDLPPITDEGEFIMEPEAILDGRWVKKGSQFIAESLVKWRSLPAEEATWENTAALRDKFQAMDLEDKDPVNERSIDRPRRSG
ncbi:hypothetical protein F0562_014974 [Nyssa sinensis]|uniref:Chromo domain-containing protein n=1 Tax=Nyssa sinensis TaxID=561372 RepID=A0A5J4ZSD7_9ASTE|nr:hypothetical protein F0562_014974 [Nyssa sinensis]